MKNFLKLLFLLTPLANAATLTVSTAQVFPGVEALGQNYVANPSCAKNTTGWTKSAGTFVSDSTSSAFINATNSCKFTPTTAADYVELTTAITTRVDIRGNNCEARVSVLGNASGYTIGLYDSTNLVISVPGVSSTTYQDYSLPYPCGTGSSAYKIRLTSTTGTNAINFGKAYFGPITSISFGSVISDWRTDWVPTGTWTSNTTYTGKWRRVGDSMEGYVRWSLSGAPNSADFAFNLPTSYAIDTNKINSTTASAGSFGSAQANDDSAATHYVGQVAYSTSGQLRVTGNATAFFWSSAVNNPMTWANLDYGEAHFVVPIAGWGSNGSAITPTQQANILGTSFYTASATCPANSLTADGSSLAVVNYPALFAVIGYTFGGSGANFNLPDLRGIFVRGAGTGTAIGGITYSGTLGTRQGDQFQGHYHNGVTGGAGYVSGGATPLATDAGAGTFTNKGYVREPLTDGTNGGVRSGSETRPANIGMTPCIWNATAPTPILIGSVTSGTTGSERIERAKIHCASGGSSAVQSGAWISSVGTRSGYACTTNFATGVFSSAPSCSMTLYSGGGTIINNGGLTNTSLISYQTTSSTGGTLNTDYDFDIICMGPR